MKPRIKIDDQVVEEGADCYVIAEIGHNHRGDVEICKQLFDAAKMAGANAVKLQKRHNKSLFTKEMYDTAYNSENSYAETYGAHRDYLEFEDEEFKELIAYAKEINITLFATPFDIPSADFLNKYDMPAYKIASGDLTNIPLIKHVAEFGKPLILSTGGGSMEDVSRAYETVIAVNSQLCIMQCTSGYPAKFEELNLRVIETFAKEYPKAVIGLSAHDNSIAMGIVGYILGAQMIEKHFTLNRAWKGTDQAFSLEPGGLRRFVRDLQRARISLGDGVKSRYKSEEAPLEKMCKSLVANKDLPAGHILTESDIAIKSPGIGMPPYEIENIIGQKLAIDIESDTNFSRLNIKYD